MADRDLDFDGPLFDGRAAAAGRRLVRDMSDTLGQRGKEMILERLGQVIKHPTGYYESQVRAEAHGSVDTVITDGGVVYGPWLEGTSSRNETTRFKGYGTFRRVAQELERDAEQLTRGDVDRAVREMQ